MKRLAQYKPVPECTCPDCVGCCENKPGWFAPGEVAKLADYLGLSVQETFKHHLVVDYWIKIGGNINVLAPGVVGKATGAMMSRDPNGQCVFLSEGRCSIHAVKPAECRLAGHGSVDGGLHESMANAWDNEDAQCEALALLDKERRKS